MEYAIFSKNVFKQHREVIVEKEIPQFQEGIYCILFETPLIVLQQQIVKLLIIKYLLRDIYWSLML